jgi:hypothetical protein
MAIAVQCGCGKSFSAKDEYAGKRAKCPACGKVLYIPLPAPVAEPADPVGLDDFVPAGRGSSGEPMSQDSLVEIRDLLSAMLDALQGNASAQQSNPAGRRQYKVLTQKDKWFTQKFEPEKLEQALNSYADQGWVVRGVTTASFPGFVGGNRDEMIIIMER